MGHDRKEVNEKESDHCPIQFNYISYFHFREPNYQTHANKCNRVGNFLPADGAFWSDLHPKNAEQSFTTNIIRVAYLLMSRNSGNTEYKCTK